MRAEAEREVRVRVAAHVEACTGRSNTVLVAVGRRVEQDQLVAFVEGLAARPRRRASTVRDMFLIGDTQRSISSTPVVHRRRVGAQDRRAGRGARAARACPPLMTWRVVSSPPMRISSVSCTIDSSSSRSPSTSAWHRMLTRSSAAASPRSAITPSWNSRNAELASQRPLRHRLGGGLGGRAPDQVVRPPQQVVVRRSGSKPSMSAISSSGSGAAMSHTKSHSPRSQHAVDDLRCRCARIARFVVARRAWA